jgi:hypothetical protein
VVFLQGDSPDIEPGEQACAEATQAPRRHEARASEVVAIAQTLPAVAAADARAVFAAGLHLPYGSSFGSTRWARYGPRTPRAAARDAKD